MKNITTILIRTISAIEVIIGLTTIIGVTLALLLTGSQKPLNVMIFVYGSAIVSTSIGIGIFRLHNDSRRLLVFFAGFVVLTKILLFMKLVEFRGEIFTIFPSHLKNITSVIYHLALIVILENKFIKEKFISN